MTDRTVLSGSMLFCYHKHLLRMTYPLLMPLYYSCQCLAVSRCRFLNTIFFFQSLNLFCPVDISFPPISHDLLPFRLLCRIIECFAKPKCLGRHAALCACVVTIQSKHAERKCEALLLVRFLSVHLPIHSNVYPSKTNFTCRNDG